MGLEFLAVIGACESEHGMPHDHMITVMRISERLAFLTVAETSSYRHNVPHVIQRGAPPSIRVSVRVRVVYSLRGLIVHQPSVFSATDRA